MNIQVKRLITGIIDMMVLSTTTASIFALLFLFSLFLSYFAGLNINNIKTMSTMVIIAIITMYETVFLYFFQGKTLGKMIFGVQVKPVTVVGGTDQANGSDQFGANQTDGLDIYTCLLRGLVKGIVIAGFSGVILFLNILCIGLGHTSKMIYDVVAKTTVELEGGK